MNDHIPDLEAAVRAVVAKGRTTDSSASPPLDHELWSRLTELGFTSLGMPEHLGGSGGDARDVVAVVESSAGAPVPIAEALMLAAPLLASGGLRLPDGAVTAVRAESLKVSSTGELTGDVGRTPWFCDDTYAAVLLQGSTGPEVALIRSGQPGVETIEQFNLAGEPRHVVRFERVRPMELRSLPEGDWNTWFDMRGALARAAQIATISREVLLTTVQHVREREQFGRPLIQLQAVQQLLAMMAGRVTAMSVAVDGATAAIARDAGDSLLLVASAKAEASAGVRTVTTAAHQMTGALGFTMEHRLGGLTKRLWAWRDEFGHEDYWHDVVAELIDNHSLELWPLLTGGSGRD